MKELMIEAKPEHLDAVLDFIRESLEAADCPMKLQNQIAIAAEEIFVNIAHYAYNPTVGGAMIRVSVDKAVTIEFEDKGRPYNPLDRADPDVTATADERRIGGLGIYMVKKIMDQVEYRHIDNKNLLIVKKELL